MCFEFLVFRLFDLCFLFLVFFYIGLFFFLVVFPSFVPLSL